MTAYRWNTVDFREATPGYRVAVLVPEEADVVMVPICGWLLQQRSDKQDVRVVAAFVDDGMCWEPVNSDAPVMMLRPGEDDLPAGVIGKWLVRHAKEQEAYEARHEPVGTAGGEEATKT